MTTLYSIITLALLHRYIMFKLSKEDNLFDYFDKRFGEAESIVGVAYAFCFVIFIATSILSIVIYLP